MFNGKAHYKLLNFPWWCETIGGYIWHIWHQITGVPGTTRSIVLVQPEASPSAPLMLQGTNKYSKVWDRIKIELNCNKFYTKRKVFLWRLHTICHVKASDHRIIFLIFQWMVPHAFQELDACESCFPRTGKRTTNEPGSPGSLFFSASKWSDPINTWYK